MGVYQNWINSGRGNVMLSLPMKDAATAHINEAGTGDFSLNGTIATSERGANQDNCKASYFDGTADYLSRTSLTGIADGKQFTLSFTARRNSTTVMYAFSVSDGTNYKFYCTFNPSGQLVLIGISPAPSLILNATSVGSFPINSSLSVTISIDLSDTAKRIVRINNTDVSMTWATYTNDTIDFTNTLYRICANYLTSAGNFYNGNIGELYFNTTYVDLSTNNPFWDKDTNKPKPVRQVIRETGVTPLIAMPLDASNAGKNYGTGGDFTLNGGGLVGARGASEFWARTINCVSDSTNYLSRYTSVPNSYYMTLAFYATPSTSQTTNRVVFETAGGTSISYSYGTISVTLNGGNVQIAPYYTFDKGGSHLVLISKTLSTWTCYVNGVAYSLSSSVNPQNQVVFTGTSYVGTRLSSSTSLGGNLGMLYISTDYIDFSQEANRLKFVDGLGYPLDLKKQIDAGVIPNPLIYLPFDDTTNLGKNLGTGGDFTINGSITQGADFAL